MNPRLLTTLIFWIGLLAFSWSRSFKSHPPYDSACALAGLLLLMLGGMRLAEEKGHSRWLGILGMLGALGAVVLLLLPRRTEPVPESPASRHFKQVALLIMMGLGAVLVRDAMVGANRRWLPEVSGDQIFSGLPLFVVAGVAYLRQLRQNPAENPRLAQVASSLLWVARGLGILLILTPFLVMFNTLATLAPGRSLGEGAGLGISLVFAICLPTGLALTLASFWPRPKQSPVPPAPVAKPDSGRE